MAVTLRRRAYEALLATASRARIGRQRFADRRILGQLADSSPLGARLVACFDRLDTQTSAEHARIHAVERERRQMLQDDGPLIDGPEAEPAPYDKGQTIGAATKVSKSPRGALLLFQLIREFKPQLVVELGTNVGISAAYQAAALNENADGGRLVTLEASPYRLRRAKSLHAKLGLENISYVQGLFSDTLQAALAEHGQVDLAYIDGHHQYQPTLDYFDTLSRYSRQTAIFVFDDIRWSEGMLRAWTQLRADPRLDITVDLGSMGLGCQAAGGPRATPRAIYSVLHPRDPAAKADFEERALRS